MELTVKEIYKQGGSAVDMAIAVGLCEDVTVPGSRGVGGGFEMLIYDKKTGIIDTLNARGMAPLKSTRNMYLTPKQRRIGGKSIAVPGALKGYEYAHKRYGKLPWSNIVKPIIDLCKKGFTVSKYQEAVFTMSETILRNEYTLRDVFINSTTNETYKEGDIVKNLKLAQTLAAVAFYGADAIYDGILTVDFVKDINNMGGIITKDDLKLYEPLWGKSISSSLPHNLTLHTMGLPSSGILLNFILNVLKNNMSFKSNGKRTSWQPIDETFKYAFALRNKLGDPRFSSFDKFINEVVSDDYADRCRKKMLEIPTIDDFKKYGSDDIFTPDHGSSHICILAPDGDAVSFTATLNSPFGAQRMSRSTGIILNNEMNDFASEFPNKYGKANSTSKYNFIQPLKRPISPMCPSIILTNDGRVRLLIGAAGGQTGISSTALVIMLHLWFDFNLQEAIRHPRMHHPSHLFPMRILSEADFTKHIATLEDTRHRTGFEDPLYGFNAVTGIAKYAGNIEPVTVTRRRGSAITLI